jgi:hypothetical protein
MEVALSNNGSDETRCHHLKGTFPGQRPQRYKKDRLHSEVILEIAAERNSCVQAADLLSDIASCYHE